MAQDSKVKSLGDLYVNKANPLSAKAQQAQIVSALPNKKISDRVSIELQNTGETDWTFTVLNNDQNSYAAWSGIKTAAGTGVVVKVAHPAGLAGFRDMIKRQHLAICGFLYDVKEDADVAQFDQNLYLIESNDRTQTQISLNSAVENAKPVSSFEKTQRLVEETFVLNPSRDLVVTVAAGKSVKFTFNVAALGRQSK